MDPVRLGRQVRALRRRRGWRQVDLAMAAGVARSTVSRVERGLARGVTLAAMEHLSHALGARLTVGLSWNGEALDRLLDGDHAALVERVAVTLRTAGWDVAIEASFAIGGERGSVCSPITRYAKWCSSSRSSRWCRTCRRCCRASIGRHAWRGGSPVPAGGRRGRWRGCSCSQIRARHAAVWRCTRPRSLPPSPPARWR